jgi:hypothetical protein
MCFDFFQEKEKDFTHIRERSEHIQELSELKKQTFYFILLDAIIENFLLPLKMRWRIRSN